ncbi:hypothetical protein [Companilactobacillus sp. HBUAS59544]|uniref:hypothetical protein n=1 Tax=Companilactobacillus sp. HBUAS59544 TaxID=3109363 RepID=UPI002FF3B03C
MPTLKLNATDCFDYFVNHFELLYKNEAKFRQNAVLDPDISNTELYDALKEHFLAEILKQDKFQDLNIEFSRDPEAVVDFIIVTLSDLKNQFEVIVEINRDDTAESVAESFMTGYNSILENYAASVHEMKMSNH